MAHTGHVKFFSEAKGFGFISVEGGQDIFVAAKDIAGNPLYQDDLVTFDIEENRKGKTAKNVRGGTGNPFKGKLKGIGKMARELEAQNGNTFGKKGMDGPPGSQGFQQGGKDKNGKFGKNGNGKGKKGGGKNRNGSDDEDEDDPNNGKANNGKGILPGGNHNWVKGKGPMALDWSDPNEQMGMGGMMPMGGGMPPMGMPPGMPPGSCPPPGSAPGMYPAGMGPPPGSYGPPPGAGGPPPPMGGPSAAGGAQPPGGPQGMPPPMGAPYGAVPPPHGAVPHPHGMPAPPPTSGHKYGGFQNVPQGPVYDLTQIMGPGRAAH